MMIDDTKLYTVRFARKVDQQQHKYPPIFTIMVRVFAKDISEAMSLANEYTNLASNEYEIVSAETDGGGDYVAYTTSPCR